MLLKISSMLDAVADSLEAKGFIKEAFEVDKVANTLEIASLIQKIERILKEKIGYDLSFEKPAQIKGYGRGNGVYFKIIENWTPPFTFWTKTSPP